MKVGIHLILLYILFINFGCKESYNPDVENVQKLLVVDGLLSDETNVIIVKLSKTIPFQEKENDPEIGAIVSVSDDKGRSFGFIEKPLGTYKSKDFTYEYGRTYVLNIETTNHKKYKSSPQILYPKSELEPVTSSIKSKLIQTAFNNKLENNTYVGLEFETVIKSNSEESPFFRFANCVLVEYTRKINFVRNYDSIPGFYYCWKKYYPNETFNLNDSKYNNINENQHTLAFCPMDTTFFSIVYEEFRINRTLIWFMVVDPYYYAITTKKYHINADVHKYYKDLNVQLEAKNRIFDPISFQIKGNIYNVLDPEEPVLGVFEVSSVSMRTYSFSDFRADKTVKFKEIDTLDIEKLPLTGKLYNQYPPFWIYYYLQK